MPDELDYVSEKIQESTDSNIDRIRRQAASIPAGVPGVCDRCDEFSKRLVNGCCATCRDYFKLG